MKLMGPDFSESRRLSCIIPEMVYYVCSGVWNCRLSCPPPVVWSWKFHRRCIYAWYLLSQNFRERVKDLCSGGTILCFSLHQTNKSLECFLRSLQIGLTVYSKTFQVHPNCMWKFKNKFSEREVKCCWEGGQNTKFCSQKRDICMTFTSQTAIISQPNSLWPSVTTVSNPWYFWTLSIGTPLTANTKHLHQKKVDIHVEGEILDWVVKIFEWFEQVVSQKLCNTEKVSNTWTNIVWPEFSGAGLTHPLMLFCFLVTSQSHCLQHLL